MDIGTRDERKNCARRVAGAREPPTNIQLHFADTTGIHDAARRSVCRTTPGLTNEAEELLKMANPDDIHIPTTRQEARALGLKRYSPGIACERGHIAERNSANGQCLICNRDDMRQRRGSDPERIARLQQGKAVALPDNLRDHLIVTRAEARARNLPRYWTGVACVNGHFDERMTNGKQCLACHRDGAAKRRLADPTKDAAIKAESYKRHRDEVIAHVEAYTAANPEKVRTRRAAHRTANRDELNAKMSAYAKANRAVMRVHERRRRARKKGAEGSHTLAEIKALEITQNGQCAAHGCAHKLANGYHVDHIVPLVRDGTDYITNIQLLCPFHNQSKHARDPVEWARSLEATG